MKPYRQGDVLILPLTDEQISNHEALSNVKKDNGRIILAYGEVTGHAHAIVSEEASLWTLEESDNAGIGNDNDRLLVCLEPVALSHEEHDTIKLPVGNYIIRRQREYTPEELRTVAD